MKRYSPFYLLLVGLLLIRCAPTPVEIPGETDPPQAEKEYYELRVYRIDNQAQHERVATFLKEALIPALNRMDVSPVGIFTPIADTAFDIYMLAPYASVETFSRVNQRVMRDGTFTAAGADYLNEADPQNRAFNRIQSSLLVAFDSMPHLKIPPATQINPDRVFELRSYESFSELKGEAKVSMFNEGREIPIFERLGFHPVFFGQAMVGQEQPNLVYMVTYDSAEARDPLWEAFSNDPAWVAIKDLPKYAKTVSKIHSHMLRPLPGSQL